MKKILLTGGSGFIGRNILPLLREKYCVVSPSRKELKGISQVQIAKMLNVSSKTIYNFMKANVR